MTHAVTHAKKKKKKATIEPSDRNPPKKMSHCDESRWRMVFGSEERREQMEKQRRKREKRNKIMR